MAEWIIRRGLPLTLVSGYLTAVAISGGNPSGLFYQLLETLRDAVLDLFPQVL